MDRTYLVMDETRRSKWELYCGCTGFWLTDLAERVPLIKIGNSGSWWGVDYNFGHDHIELQVSLSHAGGRAE